MLKTKDKDKTFQNKVINETELQFDGEYPALLNGSKKQDYKEQIYLSSDVSPCLWISTSFYTALLLHAEKMEIFSSGV